MDKLSNQELEKLCNLFLALYSVIEYVDDEANDLLEDTLNSQTEGVYQYLLELHDQLEAGVEEYFNVRGIRKALNMILEEKDRRENRERPAFA